MTERNVAIVTGGSGGIGKAIIRKLIAENYAVVNVYKSNIEAAESLRNEILAGKEDNDAFVNIKMDIKIYENCKRMIADIIARFGRIDLLVNNAGISEGGLLMMRSIEKWWNSVEVNLGGTVNCTKAVVPQMIKQKSGKIINMSSVSGVKGTLGNTEYSASKAGIIGFTKAIAKELAKFGIIVNCIAPGFVDTDMLINRSEQQRKIIEQRIKSIPLGRIGKPEEVAELVNFLASGKVDYVLGQTIIMDGGHSF